jgi:small subunit ribosomal protein S6e
MVEFKAVINDPKSGKSYQRTISGNMAGQLVGKKVGDDVDGLFVQLPGYKLKITGGSDNAGFPMRGDLTGPRRRGVLVSGGVGFHPIRGGMRKRKSLRGGAISPDIQQVNLKITTRGPKSIEDAWQEKSGKPSTASQ